MSPSFAVRIKATRVPNARGSKCMNFNAGLGGQSSNSRNCRQQIRQLNERSATLISTVRDNGWVSQESTAPIRYANGTDAFPNRQSGVPFGIYAELLDTRETCGTCGIRCVWAPSSSPRRPRQRRAEQHELARTREGNDLVRQNRLLDCVSGNLVERQRLVADQD